MRRALRTAGRGAAGFLLGLAIWLGLTEPYDRLLAAVAEPIVRITERPSATWLEARGREIIVDRADLPPSSPRPGIPADELTFNIILLATLFAANRRPLETRNVVGFLAASALLIPVHVAALISRVEALYAFDFGTWSQVHFGWLARNFWGTAFHFYRVVGCFAVVFLLWWACRPPETDEMGKARRRAFSRAARMRR
jgi:hypothetical protein